MFTLHGNGVGAGIAIGRARIIHRQRQEIPKYNIEPERIEQEVERLADGIESAIRALRTIKKQMPAEDADEVKAILGAHLLMLQDPMLRQEPSAIIRAQGINAEAALQQHADNLEKVFHDIDDPYLSSKSTDVAQIINRIQGELLDEPGRLAAQPEGKLDHQIIVANDVTPADAIELKKHRIGAFITNLGGPISHTAILARSMKIPAIVGLHGAIRYLRSGDLLIIDGKRGVVLVNPDEAALLTYRRRREKIVRRIQEMDSLRDAAAETLDGVLVSLNANIGLPEEIEDSVSQNAAGVGLYRTEFLYMNRETMPDEEEQYQIYRRALQQSARPVTIRTLDLGADKQVDGGRASDAITTNPALGRRAIRLCLHDLSLFKPQLRAVYRASAHGETRLMIPMLSNIDELDQLFVLLDEVQQELAGQGYDFDPDLQIGGMVEVPAAAIAADLFAARLDFLSIGTNDLIQYTLAIDRIDDEVNYLYNPLHPSILRLIKITIDAGKAANIPVSMCGEMAGDIEYTRVLLGMGLRDFSMDPSVILQVKRQIRLTDTAKIEPKVKRLLKTADQKVVKQLMSEINR
ncbi:phosphoenolpyruvate--protein phosphotransferase [Candidatus Spongiihabitans sp.]|uniref:phosphoenolpyruvate--protein phosphotransferase n=1 Tax=Candidatus Spongiihabitans sp. TaxID=3101308 RepID=UPI003C7E2008